MDTSNRWVERFKDALIVVVLLIGASLVTNGDTKAIVESVEANTARAAIAAEVQARLSAANSCVVAFLVPAERTAQTPDCYAEQGLPYPFNYDVYTNSLRRDR